MTFLSPTTFIGIDPTAGQRPITFAALDEDKRLLALASGNLDEVLAYAAGQRAAWVAICAPRQPNQGLMNEEEIRDALQPVPRPGRWINCRLAEYELRQHQIQVYLTAGASENCPGWMQIGFKLFQRLQALGYTPYPGNPGSHLALEVYPHAAYTVLLGQAPFTKNSLEGRLQRQLVLYEQRINVADPMRFFEEITRHRLLKGILPTNELHSADELDALVAAYTAWLAANEPDQVSSIGDSREGQLVLPVPSLQPHY